MQIPYARNNIQKYEEHQFAFGGINHSAGARDGAIYDMENMSLDEAPSLSVRKKRQKMPYDIEGKVYGVGSADKLFWCGDNLADVPTFFYDGEEKFSVSATEKTFAIINKYICIFPDKKYFSLWQDEAVNLKDSTFYGSLELLNEAKETDETIKDGDVYAVGLNEPYSYFQYNSQGKWVDKKDMEEYAYGLQTRWIYLMDSWGSLESKQGSFTTRTDGILDMYESDGGIGYDTFETFRSAHTLDLNSIRLGDSTKITVEFRDSDTKESIYKKYIAKLSKITVRKSSYDEGTYYYRYSFSGLAVPVRVDENGEEQLSTGSASYVRYTATVSRIIPDLSFAFCHDNRLWGVEKDKIYASKLGDPFNFNDYSLIADASWAVGIASSGPFTGGIAYNGYPTFFKEDSIIRVSGNYPSQYSTYETADVPGVAKGSGKSLAIANGYLYYLSPEGVCGYSGSYPTVIGENIGEVLSSGVAGAGSDKYFLEAERIPPVASDIPPLGKGGKAVYVYDTRYKAWTKEEALDAVGFTDIGRDLYALSEDGIYLLDSDKASGDAEADFDSFVEFAPIYDGHLTKKGLSKLHISLEVAEGANVAISVSYDNGKWIKVKDINSTERQNINIPLTIRRCGTYRIKFEGKGHYIIYAIGKVRYFGSDM